MTEILLDKYWTTHLRPEQKLLLLTIRRRNSAEFSSEFKRLLDGPIDWTRLIEIAQAHKLVEMLYWSLRAQKYDAIPEALLANMVAATSVAAAINEHLLEEVVSITTIANQAHIPIVHMKGPTLAVSVYGEGSLRRPGDLDVLIPREHLSRMLDLLKNEQYTPTVVESIKRATWETLHKEEVRTLGWAVTLRQEERLIAVDLHWRLMKNAVLSVPIADVWNAREFFDYRGNQIPVFEPSMNFLYLARHAAKHGWEQLRWIADLVALTESPAFDFNALLTFATKHKYRRFVLFALELVRRCPGARVPDSLVSAIEADPVVKQQADRLWQRIFVDENRQNEKEILAHLSALEDSRWRAMSLLADAAVTPTLRDWERSPVSLPLFGVYYLLRPLRLLTDYGLRSER